MDMNKSNNFNKFEQIFLYILNKVGGKPNIGETVLHKLMYFIDFDYYEKYNTRLTGINYKKNHHGPTFDHSLINSMVTKNLIECIHEDYGPYRQKKYIALKEADLQGISAIEIKHIDKVLNNHSDKTTKQIEDYSHKDVPWVITNEQDTIPYESVFYRDDSYAVKDLEDEL